MGGGTNRHYFLIRIGETALHLPKKLLGGMPSPRSHYPASSSVRNRILWQYSKILDGPTSVCRELEWHSCGVGAWVDRWMVGCPTPHTTNRPFRLSIRFLRQSVKLHFFGTQHSNPMGVSFKAPENQNGCYAYSKSSYRPHMAMCQMEPRKNVQLLIHDSTE